MVRIQSREKFVLSSRGDSRGECCRASNFDDPYEFGSRIPKLSGRSVCTPRPQQVAPGQWLCIWVGRCWIFVKRCWQFFHLTPGLLPSRMCCLHWDISQRGGSGSGIRAWFLPKLPLSPYRMLVVVLLPKQIWHSCEWVGWLVRKFWHVCMEMGIFYSFL